MTNEEIEAFYIETRKKDAKSLAQHRVHQLGNISRIMNDDDPRKAQVNAAYSELKTKMVAHILDANNDDKPALMTTSQAFSVISDGIIIYPENETSRGWARMNQVMNKSSH